MADEPVRIGEVLTTKLFTSEGPTVRAFKAARRIRAFGAEIGMSQEEINEAVHAIFIDHNRDEHSKPQQQWADTLLDNLRERYREHQRSLSAKSGRDQTEESTDQS